MWRQGWDHPRLHPRPVFAIKLNTGWTANKIDCLNILLIVCCSGAVDAWKHCFSWTTGGNLFYPADPRLWLIYLLSSQIQAFIWMLLKEIEGREPVFSPHFWNQISLWNLSCSHFIPDRIDCFSSLFVPTSLSVDRYDHLTCFFWYLIFPFITLAWSLNGVILIATCYLLPSTPFTLAKVKFLKCNHLNISGRFHTRK